MANYRRRIINPYKNLLFLRSGITNRGVAQLVAYYVRDVGAGSSSLLTPTNEKAWHSLRSFMILVFVGHCPTKPNEIKSPPSFRKPELRRAKSG